MFNQILTTFQDFFSRSFWFGKFLPVAVVAAMHVALIDIVFPGTLPVADWIGADAGTALSGFTLLVAILVVLAYALAPMVPLVRELIDGRLLPDWIHFALRRERIVGWHKGLDATRSAMREVDRTRDREIVNLRKAREVGIGLETASNTDTIDAAKEKIDRFDRKVRSGRLPKGREAQSACDALAAALSANASELPPATKDEEQTSNAKRITKLHAQLIVVLDSAAAESRYRFDRLADFASPLDLDKFQATRVGDARWLSERYAKTAYNVDHDFLWPRLPLAVNTEDKGFPQRLGDAASQIEFSVLAFTLTLTVPVVWLPILVMTQQTPWLFLGIGIATPFVLRFFYEMVVQSQNAFGRTVKGAVDHYRLDLLMKTLHLPMPATLSAERALWHKLQDLEKDGNEVDIAYDREKAAS
ncbi:MAG: hypothetical protein GY798_07495 [Hyphomicrobiales bacterium]|nr:hypothetical protein [Hyphomicrobiales bacterium]